AKRGEDTREARNEEYRAPRGAAPHAPRNQEPRPPRGATPRGEDNRAPRPGAPRAPRGEAAPPAAPREPMPARERFEDLPRRADRNDFEERNDIVFGRHPAIAALEGQGAVNKVWVLNGLRNQEFVTKVRQLAKEKGATVQMVERPKLDQLTNEANHQGVVVSLAMAAYVEIEDVIAKALAQPYPALLLLDGIEDPHNLGALIRSAEGASFAGVVIASRRAVGLTPVVAKSSAGAHARVPVARVGNLAQAAAQLKQAGFWLVGADAEGEKLPYEVDLAVPLVIVIGGEGKGLGRLLAEKCDFLVKLPLGGELESLNASVAGGVLMYEAVRQRWVKDRPV
ncbi:MAG: rlmB, partial [Cyanobacteria bacterium RYN_339]|nr:rlmB [Cyanobacteria bacterium RYN_339]